MGMVNTENLEEGMVLLSDAKSGNQVLLAKGVALTSKHINIFKSWGVNAVDVEGACEKELTDKKLQQLTSVQRRNIEEKLNEKFRHVDLDFYPAQVLYNSCLLTKLE